MPASASANLKLALIAIAAVPIATAMAQTAAPPVVALTPAEMKWQSQGGLATGFTIAPHSHPDSREVTIISGTYATGYGEKFDAEKLKVLPAGSFYTEPANIPHYIEIKEEVVLQVSGTGPSGRHFVDRPEGSK